MTTFDYDALYQKMFIKQNLNEEKIATKSLEVMLLTLKSESEARNQIIAELTRRALYDNLRNPIY